MSKSASLLLGFAVSASAAGLLAPPPAYAARPLTTSFPAPLNVTLQNNNTISVNVFGGSRRPINDIYVELLTDMNSTLARQKTMGAGRAVFNNLALGRYRVRVLPYGTEYAEQQAEVELVNYSASSTGGTVYEQLDVYLKVREDLNSGPFAAPPGVVFAQDVPDKAKRLYEQGVVALRSNNEKEGLESLRKAIEMFPTYYAALERLGTEYVIRGTPAHYEAARVLLMKAAEVNPRGFATLFGLGLAQYKLKMNDPAIENLKRAAALYVQSVDAHLYLGMALNQAGKTAEAEAALKRANEVGKGKAAEVHFQLARLYSAQNRYSEAANALELYLKNKPDSPDAAKMKQTVQQLRDKATKK